MNIERLFKALLILAGIALFAIRFYYQRKVKGGRGASEVRERGGRLFLGGLAAVVNILFAIEYIFFQGVFWWAYLLRYPLWLRWFGVALLAAGVPLLALAHKHLGENFNSFVATKEGHEFVNGGPYRWIRHPIYTAYALNYLGGGLVSGNWVLTFVPALLFAGMVASKVREEEVLLLEVFGAQYREYMQETKKYLPKLW